LARSTALATQHYSGEGKREEACLHEACLRPTLPEAPALPVTIRLLVLWATPLPKLPRLRAIHPSTKASFDRLSAALPAQLSLPPVYLPITTGPWLQDLLARFHVALQSIIASLRLRLIVAYFEVRSPSL
jgi:hypothetical protein